MNATLFKILSRCVQQPLSRLLRGKTLGVRVAVFDSENRILLVRHTYAPGWLMPGGGVNRGELLKLAAAREIREEAGIIATGNLQFHGVFSNETKFAGDFVCCYVLRQFTRNAWKPNLEIAEARFFSIEALPDDVTGGTKRRLAEILRGQEISEHW